MRISLIILLLISAKGFGQDTTRLTLAFMGDIMGHDSQINSARIGDSNQYDYKSCFKYIKDDIKSADIAIANLEVTLAGPPFKGYPAFSSPDTLADALIDCGIDALVMANNHCVDRRKKGLERTCDVLDKKRIPRTGVFKDSIDRSLNNPMFLEKKGIRLAVLNYTYGTNGIRVQHPNIVNHIDTALMAGDIEKARMMNADEIIVCLHWGWEYQTLPNPEQKMLAYWLKSKGINIVIGSHPHVLQPMEYKNNESSPNIVAYSMGNFISNQRPGPRDGAAILFIELEKADGICHVKHAEYQLTWVYTPIIGDKKHFYVLPAQRYKEAKWMQETARIRMNEYIKEARNILKYNIAVDEKNFKQPLKHLKGYQMNVSVVNPGDLVSLRD